MGWHSLVLEGVIFTVKTEWLPWAKIALLPPVIVLYFTLGWFLRRLKLDLGSVLFFSCLTVLWMFVYISVTWYREASLANLVWHYLIIKIIPGISVLLGYLSGKRKAKTEIETEHSYFSRLKLWPKKAKGKSTQRWEAEYEIKSIYSNGKIRLYPSDIYQFAEQSEPTTNELQFCRQYLADLSSLFPIVYNGLKLGWEGFFNEKMPINWEKQCTIAEITVPVNGDPSNSWEVVLYVKKTDDFLYILIENGISSFE